MGTRMLNHSPLRIKNWHELKETLSETVTVSDNWFVFNVDSVYCTVCLCISDRICSLLQTCTVRFVIIKNCFAVAESSPFFVGIWGSITHFFRAWGNTTHFQNELKQTLGMDMSGAG